MRLLRLLFLLTFLFGLTLNAPARAADVGTVAGRVVDKRTGHAIPFASVTIPEVKRGGLTDSEGQYSLSGVPAGTWEVRVQFLGYRPGSQPGVVVTAGRTTNVDFTLTDIVVREEKAVEVTAERRLVEVKQGATMRSVDANEIRNLAVTTVGDVLQQQAGISTDADQIHVRGGRTDETVFVVNGVANRDLVTGQSTAGQLNARSVAEVNVATGAYDVRYGNALSGVVEIKLKEGTDKFQAGVTTSTGSYGGRSWQGVVSGPDPLWTPVLRLVGIRVPGTVTSILDLSGSLFETRFSYLNQPDATLLERTIAPPYLHPRLHSSYQDSFFGRTFTYPDMWSPAQDNRWAARYGLTWKPNAKDKLSYSLSKRIAIDQGFSRTFLSASGDLGDPAYPWRWAKRLDHAPTIFEDNVQTSLLWRRTLSTTGWTEAQVSRYFFAQRQDVGGKMWWEYVEPDDRSAFPSGDPRRTDYFNDTGDDNQWSDRRTTSWGLSWSITQRLHHNEIEAGFEHQWQTVQYLDIEYPWIYDPNGLGQSHDLWIAHPWVGDFYVRDRLEYEGFIANVGIRADYWVIGREAEQALADTARHNIASSQRTGFYDETRSFFGRRAKVHFSPRVIVSHPITENSSFFFNYGEFTQIPSYRYVYSKLNSISSESFPLQGNPNLNPQVSVNYEVGAKHQFLPTAAANLTFFVKDVYDYPSATRVDPLSGIEHRVVLHLPERPLLALEGVRDRDREAPLQPLGGEGLVFVPADEGQEQQPERGEGAPGDRRRVGDPPVRGLRELEPPAQADRELRRALRREPADGLALAAPRRPERVHAGAVGPRLHAVRHHPPEPDRAAVFDERAVPGHDRFQGEPLVPRAGPQVRHQPPGHERLQQPADQPRRSDHRPGLRVGPGRVRSDLGQRPERLRAHRDRE